MQLLLMHVDYIEYHVTRASKNAEVIDDAQRQARMEDALVIFVAVERTDEQNLKETARVAAEEIGDIAGKVATQNIMLYPYAHLAHDLASPELAVQALKIIASALSEYLVIRAPFGWYKSFSLKCKGHPLSELSRSITLEAKREKQTIERKFFVLSPDNTLTHASDYCGIDEQFQQIIAYELGEHRPGDEKELPHIKLMREKELVDYEPLSDVGHLKWLPKGKLIRDLLIDYTYFLSVNYGAMPVETPVMYDLSNRAVNEHADKFGERQYRLKAGNRQMMLRFAACFGMFSMMHNMHLTEKDLPLKLYELSTYSFRYEQRGEVMGLKRQRAFTMPDMHTACRDMDQARQFFVEQLRLGFKSGEEFDITYQPIFRATEAFYRQNERWVAHLIREFDRPFLLELLSERVHYWVCKCDLAALDTSRKPIECPTVQIDVESAERFDIKYYSEKGEKRPIILHTSPTGGIERVIAAILETQAAKSIPQLPVWLAPVQVRVVPVSDKHLQHATQVYNEFTQSKLRADIDDRDESVSRKIAQAGREWIPYIVVVGQKEEQEHYITTTTRHTGEKKRTTVAELVDEIHGLIDGMPFRPLPFPQRLSQRPTFM